MSYLVLRKIEGNKQDNTKKNDKEHLCISEENLDYDNYYIFKNWVRAMVFNTTFYNISVIS